MKNFKKWTGTPGLVLGGALLLTGCTTYVEPPRARETYVQPTPVYAPPAAVEVVIRSETDFYEPLTPYGRWETVGAYGRCWIPGRVDPDWRPYAHGRWERTDAGWYWVSDEPWAWATYHYGRWDFTAQFGWYWVPQTQWAPAWVSWHEGGGYVGWAPLHPTARIAAGGVVTVNAALIAPRAYVFVEPRHFLQPVRPATVINNNTIINQTVNITKTKIVNNTVINEGPRTTVIEQASGQRLQPVPVRELRRKQEAEVAVRPRIAAPDRDKKEIVAPPVRTGPSPVETRAAQDAARRAKEAEAAAQAQSQKNARELERQTQLESQRRANEAAAKAQAEARGKAEAFQKEEQQRRQALDRKAQSDAEAQRAARELEKKTQLESQRRASEAAAKAQRAARELERKTQFDTHRRANEAAVKAQEEARRQAQEAQREAQQRRQELEKKAPAEPEKKAVGRPEPRPKQGNFPGGSRGTNSVQKLEKQKGDGKGNDRDGRDK